MTDSKRTDTFSTIAGQQYSRHLQLACEAADLNQVSRLLHDSACTILPDFTRGPYRFIKLITWAKALTSDDADTKKFFAHLLGFELGGHDYHALSFGAVESLSDLTKEMKLTGPTAKRIFDVYFQVIVALALDYWPVKIEPEWEPKLQKIRLVFIEAIGKLLQLIPPQYLIRFNLTKNWGISPEALAQPLFLRLCSIPETPLILTVINMAQKNKIDLGQFIGGSHLFAWIFSKPPSQLPISERELIINRLLDAGIEPQEDIITYVEKENIDLINQVCLKRFKSFLEDMKKYVPETVAAITLQYVFGESVAAEARGVRTIVYQSSDVPQSFFHTELEDENKKETNASIDLAKPRKKGK